MNELTKYIAFSSVVGSRAYGLAREESDTDRRGFYVLPAELHWSARTDLNLRKQFELPQRKGDVAVYWEIERALQLMLSNNPDMLSVLFSPIIEVKGSIIKPLLENKERFLSRRMAKTYQGYAAQQFEKLRANAEACAELGLTPKHYDNPGCRPGTKSMGLSRRNSMHMIRMLLQGIKALKEGTLTVDATEYRGELQDIRSGAISLKEAHAWSLELILEFKAALQSTRLPGEPDRHWADQYLLWVRRRMASRDIFRQPVNATTPASATWPSMANSFYSATYPWVNPSWLEHTFEDVDGTTCARPITALCDDEHNTGDCPMLS